MEKIQEKSDHTNGRKYAKQIKTARIALERLAKDDYAVDLLNELILRKPISENKFKQIVSIERYMRKQDFDLFSKIFSRHSEGWWD